MRTFTITTPDKSIQSSIQHKIDFKTKPLGALGTLEQLALQIATIQGTTEPVLNNPHLVVFAADHGIAQEGVSKYPPEVTFQMVMNFVRGGAAINVFCKQNQIKLQVVDAGVNGIFDKNIPIIHNKLQHTAGTKNILKEPAMSIKEGQKCIDRGATVVQDIFEQGCNIIGFGEMGIGNTSSASLIMSKICKIPVSECVGRGTGVDDEALKHKVAVLTKAQQLYKGLDSPLKILTTFGGFEIAQMVGAMLQAAQNKMIILVDGFIATAAFLVASKIEPTVKEYAIFCHQSDENGHKKMLDFLGITPLLQLNLRLGEGTGCALAYPIVKSAVTFLNSMASFEVAGVSNAQ
ncbi:nicotinate-nucleotide--dimethylbenzimidazole phosphoribosyltransferase [Flectobacillus major]|jgi:nicotinate-nucleotide--dimethylbenzimidazole phosphoribosyltransferase|uniref:nicotinate-nucleotide--dimethylbenzimidazole phosphoribosyltransferase n=1 Tax=Flectobacillus major TaxID=103 RepID=UPI0004279ED6|nr:nicotinate-nucleotide--dimethylbenzimidazole phosphoribosyltransferase [Flectobacillus major]